MQQSHNSHVRVVRESADWRWEAIAGRNRAADGQFFYAVTSTGVFCRPSCPSRRPRRERVRFFDSIAAAQAAGFRACRRCRPTGADPSSPAGVQRAVAYLASHVDAPVSLATLGRVAGLSPFHLQRQFKKVVGVSPREFQAAQRAERFRQQLRAGSEVTAAVYEAGYGSPSRVYEAAPTGPGLSPADYRRGAAGARIGFVCVRSPLGWMLVAATAKGVCAVKLGTSRASLEQDLRSEFPGAEIEADRLVPRAWVEALVAQCSAQGTAVSLPLDVQGTAFQWKVWRALQAIPPGETRSYSDIAESIGAPSSTRAVARACASNPVGLVIPCHRVVPKAGGAGGYRWGAARKQRLLRIEQKAK
jgi:AraC family transcriptional regulator of adaptative response/methylated-DNA-[protein]-cysteine methyltransferase